MESPMEPAPMEPRRGTRERRAVNPGFFSPSRSSCRKSPQTRFSSSAKTKKEATYTVKEAPEAESEPEIPDEEVEKDDGENNDTRNSKTPIKQKLGPDAIVILFKKLTKLGGIPTILEEENALSVEICKEAGMEVTKKHITWVRQFFTAISGRKLPGYARNRFNERLLQKFFAAKKKARKQGNFPPETERERTVLSVRGSGRSSRNSMPTDQSAANTPTGQPMEADEPLPAVQNAEPAPATPNAEPLPAVPNAEPVLAAPNPVIIENIKEENTEDTDSPAANHEYESNERQGRRARDIDDGDHHNHTRGSDHRRDRDHNRRRDDGNYEPLPHHGYPAPMYPPVFPPPTGRMPLPPGCPWSFGAPAQHFPYHNPMQQQVPEDCPNVEQQDVRALAAHNASLLEAIRKATEQNEKMQEERGEILMDIKKERENCADLQQQIKRLQSAVAENQHNQQETQRKFEAALKEKNDDIEKLQIQLQNQVSEHKPQGNQHTFEAALKKKDYDIKKLQIELEYQVSIAQSETIRFKKMQALDCDESQKNLQTLEPLS